MILQEPSEGERINVGLMKELTGSDKVQARGLFKEPIEFKPQFKMVLTCNDLPIVPADDGGTWRRIRVLEFMSHFVEKVNPNKLYEYELDPELTLRYDIWKETFMSIIIKYYKEYLITGIVEPVDVIERSNKYRRENHCYAEFTITKISFETKSVIDATEMYEEFKWWFRDHMPSSKIPNFTEFKRGFDKQLGLCRNNKWIGVKLIQQESNNRIRPEIDEDEPNMNNIYVEDENDNENEIIDVNDSDDRVTVVN